MKRGKIEIPFLIGFVGFDGTGKTTQAKWLQHTLVMQGINANYTHIFSHGSTISSELAENSIVDSLTAKLDDLSNTKIGAILELMVRLPSLVFESWITVHRHRHRNNVTIYDRYFYDKIVAIVSSYSRMLDLSIKKRVLSIAKLLPRPDITILFRTRPEVANRRKKEHTLEEAKEICALYDELGHILSINAIDAEMEIEDVQLKVQRLCEKVIQSELL